jgi:hypothetical protein
MSDPRFGGGHLEFPRRERYETARKRVFDVCGPPTMHRDQFASLCRLPSAPQQLPSSQTPYLLRDSSRNLVILLHMGLNTIGRAEENDITLGSGYVSRRHCTIVVHATGGCEIHDTASRNGVYVNGTRITQVWLVPGDKLDIGGCELVLATTVNRNEMVFSGSRMGVECQSPPPTSAIDLALSSVWCSI